MLDLAKIVTKRMDELSMMPVEVAAMSGCSYNTVLNIMSGKSRGQFTNTEAILESLGLELEVREKE